MWTVYFETEKGHWEVYKSGLSYVGAFNACNMIMGKNINAKMMQN